MRDDLDFRQSLFPGSASGDLDLFVPGVRLSTRGLPAKDQLAYITQEMQPFVRKLSPLAGRSPQEGFYSDISGYYFDGLPILDVKSDGYTFLPPEKKDPSLTDSYPWILMVRLKGEAEYVVDGKRFRYAPGEVNIRTPDNQLAGTVTDSDQIMFYLDPDQVSGLEDTLNWLSSADGAASIHPLLGQYLTALGGVLPGIPKEEAATVASTTLAMIRACLSRLPDDIVAASHPMRATRLELARQHVDAHLKSPDLSPDTIRSVLALSKRRMNDLFEECGGVQNYIRGRRLLACFKAILANSGESPVMSIAEDFGFCNGAHFSRVFKAHFGWSPSDARDMARHTLATSTYERWLRDEARLQAASPQGERP
ncbi:helix-turn-helix domain-containing protein [Roseibium aestuarii]|uniref:Helix-turn-helix domain-containing protein n=1 Tax=Roseibium aestuarii TaxID=2600299 RepID=A0ABW4JXS5_9HYPH|nr:helix-turn-helix domain-containing protein [Roseibium aestuarii]